MLRKMHSVWFFPLYLLVALLTACQMAGDDSTALTIVSESSASVGDVVIEKVNGYLDVLHTWNVVGLVVNHRDTAVTDIEVGVDVYNASGHVLYQGVTDTLLNALAPGESTPFALLIGVDLPDANHFRASVLKTAPAVLERARLDFNHLQLIESESHLHLSGEIANTTGQALTVRGLAAAAFGEKGEMYVAASSAAVASYLSDGESAPFRVTINRPGQGIIRVDDFQIYADAEYSPALDPFAVVVSSSYFAFQDGFSQPHLVGEVRNEGDQDLNVRLLAGAYNQNHNVIDAAILDLPIASLQAGESLPFDVTGWGGLGDKPDLFDSAVEFRIWVDPVWTWRARTTYVTLDTADETFQTGGRRAVIGGRMINRSGQAVKSAVVVIGVRNIQSGQLLGTGSITLWEEIPAGESIPFTVDVALATDYDPAELSYFVIAKGERTN